MILAADWLSISINLLLVVFVVVCLLLSLVVLMQRPKQEGLGAAFGSGMTDQMFGARTTNVLQKATVYLATLFFVLTLSLAVLYSRRTSREISMVAETVPTATEETSEAPPEESVPSLEESIPVETESPTPDASSTEEAPVVEEAPVIEEAPPAVEAPTPAEDASAEESPTPAPQEESPVEDEQ